MQSAFELPRRCWNLLLSLYCQFLLFTVATTSTAAIQMHVILGARGVRAQTSQRFMAIIGPRAEQDGRAALKQVHSRYNVHTGRRQDIGRHRNRGAFREPAVEMRGERRRTCVRCRPLRCECAARAARRPCAMGWPSGVRRKGGGKARQAGKT